MRHTCIPAASRAAKFAALAGSVVLAGCTSITIPFSDLRSSPETAQVEAPLPAADRSIVTGSTNVQTDVSASTTPLPPPLDMTPPSAFLSNPPSSAGVQAAPTEQLVATASASQVRAAGRTDLSLSANDLRAMGVALTAALQSDSNPGTFAWSNAPEGSSGVMTPFRSSGTAENCRVVSVEVERDTRDAIVLADACEEQGNWVFVTPRPGQML